MLTIILIIIILLLIFYIIGSKSNSSTPSNDISKAHEDSNNDTFLQFSQLSESRPNIEDYFGRSFNDPKYNDKYDTGTEFSLRQLLLVVWFSRTKKGRLVSSSIPQYFFYDYNINGQKLLQQFIARGWIVQDNDRYILSTEAKDIANQYEILWELHRNNQFPFCLDKDYPNWNHGALLKSFYKKEIAYLEAYIEYTKKLIEFYENSPSFFTSKEEQEQAIQIEKDDIKRSKIQINKDKDKISII